MIKARPAVNLRRQSTSTGARRKTIASAPSTLVVVNRGGSRKDLGIEKDPDINRLQVIYLHIVWFTGLHVWLGLQLVVAVRERKTLNVGQADANTLAGCKVANAERFLLLHNLIVFGVIMKNV